MLGLPRLQVRSFYVVTAKELPWWYNRASYDMQEEECLSDSMVAERGQGSVRNWKV
jgi:hypothetical protein